VVSAYRLIDAEKANYSISLLCRVLRVSRSGYYDWKERLPSKRNKEDAALTVTRSRRSTSVAEGPMAIRECTPSLERWECVALASVLPS
jgi:hypothetical protein